ncbi:ABC transporter substrate-binding protein [Modestobacter roseus]|uniref:Iron complex transport system substrate-binding protein n=1 Tax=Modestobacter roseus TaxID=1181884 RepID=A0A562IVB4_9ACTN|nr:iron-siderophore ABC transporter substrate-binding protein [Modestobacter roseus]MQA33581.1 ABC transporter substrate-binding protein [Modestobacter roseus]TWH74786.1 iron complex transport system substrate-binding protein [Modestobacter roseus]
MSRTALRGTVLRGTALLAAALVVTSCGSDSGDEETSAGGGTPSSSSSGAFPVTVDTAFGEVEVPEEPTRVVALGWGDAETALALGVQPVGASDWLGFGGEGVGPWAEGLYDEAPELIETIEPSYEAIAALDPDLILDTKSPATQERYDALSAIAPTIGQPEGADQYLTSPEQQLEMIGAALGKSEEAAALQAEVDQAFADAAAAHPEFDGKTVVVGTRTSEGYGAYVEGDTRVEFMEQLGFTNSPAVQELAEDSFSVSLSNEQLPLLDADLTVMFPIFIDASEITDDALFQAVPSVQDGRAVVLDDTTLTNAFSIGTPLATQYALENAVPLFADAVS